MNNLEIFGWFCVAMILGSLIYAYFRSQWRDMKAQEIESGVKISKTWLVTYYLGAAVIIYAGALFTYTFVMGLNNIIGL